jgi:flagellar protein FlaG
MSLEAIKQATNNYNAPAPQVNAPAQAPETPVVSEVSPKQMSNPKDDFSLDESTVVYGDQTYGTKKAEDSASNNTDALKKAVDTINKKMSNSVAQFGIHDATNRVTIKIVDKETKKVLKEFPPEETLDMIAKVWELAGIMVDEKK